MRNCITVELEINSVLHLIKYEFEIELPNTAPKRWHMLGVGRMLRGLNYSCFQAQSCFQWDRNISIGMSFRFESQQALTWTIQQHLCCTNTQQGISWGLAGIWCCFEGNIDATIQGHPRVRVCSEWFSPWVHPQWAHCPSVSFRFVKQLSWAIN